MRQPSLQKILTIPEVAAIAGWDGPRMRRHLLRLHAETNGMLLHNVGGTGRNARWTVTLANLQRVAPQWFSDPESVQARLEALEAEVRKLRRLIGTVGQAVESMASA